MDLYVDGQIRGEPEGAGSTFGNLLIALRDELAAGGLAITTIKLDGEEVMPEAEAQLVSRPIAEFDRVELATAPAKDWGRHGLGEAASALGRLADEFQAVADLFRGGEFNRGVERVQGAIAAFGQLVQALVNSAALAGVGPPGGFEGDVQAVTSAMRGLGPALREADGVAAADLAEYEVAEALQKLAGAVKVMVEST